MFHNKNHHDRIIKNIGVIFLSVIILALILNLSGGNGFNNHMGYGQSVGFGIDSLFVTLLNLLFLLTVIGIVVGVLVAVQKQNLNLHSLNKLFDGGHHRRHLCSHCRQEIQNEWTYCAACGATTKKEKTDPGPAVISELAAAGEEVTEVEEVKPQVPKGLSKPQKNSRATGTTSKKKASKKKG